MVYYSIVVGIIIFIEILFAKVHKHLEIHIAHMHNLNKEPSHIIKPKKPKIPGHPKEKIPDISLFIPDELGIYWDGNDLIIYHGKDIAYKLLISYKFDPKTSRVAINYSSGHTFDLGVKIREELKPFFKNQSRLIFCQTKDRQILDSKIIHNEL